MTQAVFKKNKILIVDVQIVIRKSIKNLISTLIFELNLINLEIIEGSDGNDIIDLLSEDYFGDDCIRLIITDEDMECINGSTAIKKMRILENERNLKAKIFVSVTSSADDDINRERILQNGADKILSKPPSKNQFKDLLIISLAS